MATEENKPEVNEEDTTKRRRGRPKGSIDRKLRLKSTPKTAPEEYAKMFGDIGIVAIYGVDEFTMELIRYMWNDPHQEFVVTDPVDAILSNANREMGSRPHSLHRFEAVNHVGFVESGYYPVIVCTNQYYKQLTKLPNPHGVHLIDITKWDKW